MLDPRDLPPLEEALALEDVKRRIARRRLARVRESAVEQLLTDKDAARRLATRYMREG